MSAERGRIAVLQALRAIAALLVAQTHVVAVAGVHNAKAFQLSGGSFAYLGACGVDIFFVISGFIVPLTACRSTGTRWDFLRKRALRIYPLWLYLLGILALTKLAGGLDGGTAFDLVWSALLLPKLNPNWQPLIFMGWSLMFEVFFYALIAVLWRPRLEVICGVTAALGLAGLTGLHFPLSHLVISPMLLEFALGTAMAMLWQSGKNIPFSLAALVLTAGVCGFLYTGWTGCEDIAEAGNIVTGALAAKRCLFWGVPAAMIVTGALWLKPAATWRLTALGDASYSMYITSYYGQLGLNQLWPALAWLPGDLAILAGTLLLAGIGYLVYRVVEAPLLRAISLHFQNSK